MQSVIKKILLTTFLLGSSYQAQALMISNSPLILVASFIGVGSVIFTDTYQCGPLKNLELETCHAQHLTWGSIIFLLSKNNSSLTFLTINEATAKQFGLTDNERIAYNEAVEEISLLFDEAKADPAHAKEKLKESMSEDAFSAIEKIILAPQKVVASQIEYND